MRHLTVATEIQLDRAADARLRKAAPRIHALLDDVTEAWRDEPEGDRRKLLEEAFLGISMAAARGVEASAESVAAVRQRLSLPEQIQRAS